MTLVSVLVGGPPAGASSVGSVTAAVSPAVAGATGARWTIGFTNTTAVSSSDTVTVTAPAGTVLPNSCTYQVIDTTPNPDVSWTVCPTQPVDVNQSVLQLWSDVPAGHALQVVIDDVANSGTAGSQSVSISTSTDTDAVSAGFSLATGPTSVSAVSVVSSPAVAGATGARWTVGFTNTSALNYYYSRVVVSAPAGTVLPSSCTYQLVDTTPNPDVTLSGCVTSGGGTNEVEIYPGADVPAGHVLQLVIDDVGNPPNAGSYPVAVSTTSDRAPVTANVALTSGPTAVTGVGVALDNTLPGSTSVTYTIGFTNTSALNYYYSRVVVSAPAGTVLPSSCTYQLVDTTPNPDATTWACPTSGGGTNEVEIYVGGDVPAGHALQLVIPEVTNPASSGSKTLTIRTSSDQVPVTAGYSLGLGVSTTALPSATAGDAYSATLTATGGTGPYTWSMAPGSGALPSGLSLNATTGEISGTPAAGSGGTYSNLVFRVKDSTNATSDSIPLTLNVGAAPLIQGQAEVTFTPGVDNAFWVYAGGLPAPSLSVSGALPSGVTFTDQGNGSGTFAGTPPVGTSGDYPLVITATNDIGTDTQDFTLTVAKATSSAAVASSQNPSRTGDPVTLTASVWGGGGTPTGSVEFFDGATSLGTGTLAGGQATLVTSALTVGAHSITVVYGGDGSFLGSTSGVLTQNVVDRTDTTTALVSSSDPSVFGQTVWFTATVTGSGATPSGTVTFFDGSGLLGSVALDSNGQASFSTSSLAVGEHPVTAVYGGDSTFEGSVSAAVDQTVQPVSTTTVVSSSLNPSGLGASVTLSATVAPVAPGSGVPGGSVEFFDGTTSLGTGTLDGTGVARLVTSDLATGTHPITAVYAGTTSFLTSTSAQLDQVVNPAPLTPTSTALTSTPNPSVFGQAVTLTATVAGDGGTPTGAVTFFDGTTSLGSSALDAGGVAALPVSSLAVGNRQITAVYGGDSVFAPSSSSAQTQVVDPAGTATALTSSANPSTSGQEVTFTTTVTATAPGAGAPAGTVEFRDGATVLGTVTLNGLGAATLPTSALTAGTHSITAVYSGSSSFSTSTSPAVDQVVNETPLVATATALTSSLNPSGSGAEVTFTATVTGDGGTPTGTVELFDGATSLGTRTLDGSGSATLSTAGLTVGTHSITAQYSGDDTFATSTSTVVDQVVEESPLTATMTSLASSTNPSVVGQAVTLTATVTGAGGTPTGTVEFFDGENSIGTAEVGTDGLAATTISSLMVGNHVLTAAYGGDDDFAGSTSAGLTQAVNPSMTATTVSSSVNPSTLGQDVTFTVAVTVVAPGAGVPGGLVELRDGAAVVDTAALDEAGSASFSTSSLAVGTHQMTAVYHGNASFTTSTSSGVDQVVEATALTETTTVVASSANPSTFGQTITLTATVSGQGGTPSGSAEFRDGATLVGTAALDENGAATLDVSDLAVGDHPITAVYPGDAVFAGSTSAALTQTVERAATATVVTSSANPSTLGQTVTLHAVVSRTNPGPGTPGGSVEFFDGTTSLGTAVIDVTGAAELDVSPTVGSHPITALYAGDVSFGGSTSGVLDQVVVAAPLSPTTTELTSGPNPTTVGEQVVLTAQVDAEAGTPGGTVEFREGTTILGAVTVDGTGAAVLTTSSLSVGEHHITAVYGGDADHAGSTSDPVTQIVQDAPTCTPLERIHSVNGVATLASGGSLSVHLDRVTVPFFGSLWVGNVEYRDRSPRVRIVSLVLTRHDVVRPIPDTCRGAAIRVDGVNLSRFPWRTGKLDLRIVDRSPDAADAVTLDFPGVAPVSSSVTRGDLQIR
ncbi:MAG: Ig-like domain repeat protein [Microthrixaceae bacterium]|nr:Ig-like domain repeat protein [Microthrixaceae bacterium]